MIVRLTAILLGSAGLAACGDSGEEIIAGDSPSAGGQSPAAPGLVAGAQANAMTCNHPTRLNDTAETLRQRYGEDARVETVYGAEGTEIPGVVLWPDDPLRKVEVLFADEARTQITGTFVRDGSAWTISGLSPGDTLTEANAANGKPFDLFGFEWDYGGLVTNLNGGALSDIDGCAVSMSLGPTAETQLPLEVLGDVEISSADPRLPGQGIAIWEIGLVFPE